MKPVDVELWFIRFLLAGLMFSLCGYVWWLYNQLNP